MAGGGAAGPGGITIEHAAVPGRLRLRVPGLRGNAQLVRRLTQLGRAEEIWRKAIFREASGSVILHHDPAEPCERLTGRLHAILLRARADLARGIPMSETDADPLPQARSEDLAWHALAAKDVAFKLHSDQRSGIPAAIAADRLRRHGPNLLPQDEPRSRLALVKEQFSSLPVLMLVGSAGISLATGGAADALATLAVVATNALLGYVTEGQAESVIQALMDDTSAGSRVDVIRDGQSLQIAASDLVPGDLFLLRAGAQVMADARLVTAERLSVDESALTGETLPVEKASDAAVFARAPIGSRPTMVHAGTLVSEGAGKALVVATGRHTAAARIALLSQHATRPRAPVEEELDRLGTRLVHASLAACGLLFCVGLARGYGFSVIMKDALALAVAAVPEGLPVVATTTMALGLRRMERRGILIRRIDAVESLGALQTICLDKTGTLTQNRMEVVAVALGATEMPLDQRDALRPLAEAAALNNDCSLASDGPKGASATETALMEFALACGVEAAGLRASRPRVASVERAPRRPWMATQHEGPVSLTVVKGAPGAVLSRCTHLLDGAGSRPLDETDRAAIHALNERFAARPARVLGLARGGDPPVNGDVSGLTWLGLVAMVDPLRPGAKDFIRDLHAAGLNTVMITGDQAVTAGAIARELELARHGTVRIVDAPNLPDMDPAVLADVAARTDVFARVSADQKLAIVQALQSGGRIVAMTGDGVNDAPALKAANIGIAMGASGTDLARDVANVVIRDDKLTTLIDAIAQGRTVYRNIRRALEYLVTTNMSEIVVSLAEALHGPAELETPMELLWINIVTDVLPGLGLAMADPEPDAMQGPPRERDEAIVPEHDFRRMGTDGLTIAASTLGAHFVGLGRHGPGPETRGMTFLALSLGQLLYTITCQRTDPRKLRFDRLLENRALDQAVLASVALALLPYFLPPLGRLLGVARLGRADTAVAVACGILPAAAVLARRQVSLELHSEEVTPCATS